MSLYQKSYLTQGEVRERLKHFVKTRELIQKHNAKETGFEVEINFMSDMSPQEKTQMGGFLNQLNKLESTLDTGNVATTLKTDNLPAFVDWS